MRHWSFVLALLAAACGTDDPVAAVDAGADAPTDSFVADVGDGSTCTDTSADPRNCGECGHGCGLFGQCAGGTCSADVVSLTGPTTCVDLDVGNVYWAGGNIKPGKAPKANPKAVTEGALDLYASCRLVGSSLTVIQSGAGLVVGLKDTDLSFYTYVANAGQQGATEITALGANGAAWVIPTTGKVLACGAPPCGGTPLEIATGEASPTSIAADVTHIYWASKGAGANDGSIKRRLRGGIGPVDVVAANVARPVALALDGNEVFFGAEDGTIASVPKSGGAPKPIAKDEAPGAYHMTTDLTHVYWTNTGKGTVNRVKKTGGSILPLAIQQDKPWDLAVDATHVYWTRNSSGGGVFRVSK